MVKDEDYDATIIMVTMTILITWIGTLTWCLIILVLRLMMMMTMIILHNYLDWHIDMVLDHIGIKVNDDDDDDNSA